MMIERIDSFKNDIKAWRHDLHRHPELAFEERRTADFVAAKLESFGIAVNRGLAGTGVVGTLKSGSSKRVIGLRADMDALPILEANKFSHRSVHDGRMHACGHDGHTAMLLGAAKYLAETKSFDGTVHFIFQPAEESAGGARIMIEQGLFERFPVDAVYGLHNMPGLPVGQFAMRVGPIMASFDSFDIVVKGTGTHAALPQLGSDQIVAAAAIVGALQTVVSRVLDPTEPALVSITRIRGGDSYNVIPDEVLLSGCARCFSDDIQDKMKKAIVRIAKEVASANGAVAEVRFVEHYPPTVSTKEGVAASARAAADVVGEHNINTEAKALLTAEDFGYMLKERPGSYVLMGNGPGDGGCMLHNPRYDFNDEALAIGAKYWARMVENELAV
jgi:hippurate hydrolase